jgi:hypothetical protein
MPGENFETFHRRVEPEVATVEKIMHRALAEEPEGLAADLRRAEVWYARLQTILAYAESYLDLAEQENLPGKEKMTELERQKLLASRVARERLLRDRVSGLMDALRTRVSLGQTLLNYYRDLFFSDKARPRNNGQR